LFSYKEILSRIKKHSNWLALFLVLFIIGFLIARYPDDNIKNIKRTKILLGTIAEIQIIDKDEKKAELAIKNAFDEIKRIDDLFSTFNKNSPIWKLNNSSDSIFHLDGEIYNLILLCDSIYKISESAFDVSLDNLIRAWGFYSKEAVIPKKSTIDSMLILSCWHNIVILDENKIFRKRKVGLNFGAIAKGYAVDRAIETIKQAGVSQALVNIGGEVKTIGKNWIVGIQHPRNPQQIIEATIISDNSIATSGDYEQYFEIEGYRYHHIINPNTGYPARGIQSVSIINNNNSFADGLATAVFVMGVEKGLKLIDGLADTEAMIIDENGKIFYSKNFRNFLVNEN
jgi:thiamine biosynthesis lipoprotein